MLCSCYTRTDGKSSLANSVGDRLWDGDRDPPPPWQRWTIALARNTRLESIHLSSCRNNQATSVGTPLDRGLHPRNGLEKLNIPHRHFPGASSFLPLSPRLFRTRTPPLSCEQISPPHRRYKDGHEENLSLWRLRQLGAAFKYPRPPLAPGPVQCKQAQRTGQGGQQRQQDGTPSAGGSAGGSGGSGGGGIKFQRASKPGAERIIHAVRLGMLWGHKVCLWESVSTLRALQITPFLANFFYSLFFFFQPLPY